MSSLTRSTGLAARVQAVVRSKMSARRAEEERPEDVEDDIDPAAEDENIDPDADGEEDETSAEDDDPETEAEADETDPEAEDDGEEEKMSRKASARVRRAEQSRIKAILTHPGAQANHGLAMELAFGKAFYSAEAAGALLKSSAGGGSGLSSRMAGRSPKLGAGPGAQPTAKQALLDATRNRIQAMHGRNRKGA